MPLIYDDIPGSWGEYSIDWPSISFNSEKEHKRAVVACTKECVVPYGSYVVVGNTIRVETKVYLNNLITHLSNPNLLSYEVVMQQYNK